LSPLAQGVLLGAAAAAALGASYTLQAREARRVATARRPGAALLRRMASRPVWLGAIALTTVAFALQVLALRQVPLAVVQPVLALALVGLLVTGTRILGERVGAREIGAVLLIGAGLTAVVIAAPPHTTHTRSGALALAAYAVLAAVLAVPFLRPAQSRWALVSAAAAGDVLAALATNRLAGALDTDPGLAALWLAVAALAGLSAITSETAALQRLPATRVAPIVMGADVTLPVAIAALDAHTRWSATPGGGALLAAGVVLVGAGAVLLGASPVVAKVRGRAVTGDE
jgi:drug/metabolite transporter (DMT)-like permease